MASSLDLAEQEQLDALKHFWKSYGRFLLGALLLGALAYAGWQGWHYWQRQQAAKAALMYDEFERVAKAAEVGKSLRVFSDLRDRFASSLYTQQAGLAVAQQAFEANQPEVAKEVLTWLSAQTADPGYQAIAKLRLAALLVQEKNNEAALALLNADLPASFAPLAADRRGDIFMLEGKPEQAKAEYQKAFLGWGPDAERHPEYRRLVEVKLNALGVDTQALAASTQANAKPGAPQ